VHEWKETGLKEEQVKALGGKKLATSMKRYPIAEYLGILFNKLSINDFVKKQGAAATNCQTYRFVLAHPLIYERMIPLLRKSNRCELAWQGQDRQRRITFHADLQAWNKVVIKGFLRTSLFVVTGAGPGKDPGGKACANSDG
jgi:hypothetical protein